MKDSKKLLIAPLAAIVIGVFMWLVMGWLIGWVMILGGIAFVVVLLILKLGNNSKKGIKKYGVQKAFVSLGDMKGKTHEQIVSVCGNPRKITPTSEGTKEEWWGLIYHIVIKFDKNGNFVTIQSQGANSPSFRNMAIIFIACCVIISIYLLADGGVFTSNNTELEDRYGHDTFTAQTIAEKVVSEKLKSPSTADFCSKSEMTFDLTDGKWTVTGWVDAQNSFGASIRSNYKVEFEFTSKDKYITNKCIID